MYTPTGNSTLAACFMKWPIMTPLTIIGLGGIFYGALCVDYVNATIDTYSSPPAIIETTVIEPPKPIIPVVETPAAPPIEVKKPTPLPPKKKIKG
jgi:hypothetical protein